MAKICHINGQPYMVSVPTGGKSEDAKNNQWDELVNFIGEDCNNLFHWDHIFSWCQEKIGSDSVTRGYFLPRLWNYYTASTRSVIFGFRPVLTPLDPDTMQPDISLLEDIPDGRIFALASLYMNGKVVKNPTNPTDKGNIPDYVEGSMLTFGDRDPDPANWIHVIKHKDLLWADRNILKNISWDNIQEQGFLPGFSS